jgi:SNF family Na+-dependent transporter
MFDLGKLFGKLPDFVFQYPDCFLGLCVVVAGIPKGVEPTNAFLPFGFALIAVSMVRRNLFHVGLWRGRDDGKLHFVFKEFFASIFWAVVSWGCFRWWAMTVHNTDPWVRRVLKY